MTMGPDDDGCRAYVERLYEYIDGELTVERRQVISAHLDDCPPCGGAFGFESKLRLVISERCREEVPEQLRMQVLKALADLSE